MASGWNFFGIPNPDPGESGSGFFTLGLIEKFRKSRNPGNRYRDLKILQKFRKKNPENPKIPGIGIEISKLLKNLEKIPSAKSRKSRIRDFFGIFYLRGKKFFFRDVPTKSHFCKKIVCLIITLISHLVNLQFSAFIN